MNNTYNKYRKCWNIFTSIFNRRNYKKTLRYVDDIPSLTNFSNTFSSSCKIVEREMLLLALESINQLKVFKEELHVNTKGSLNSS